MSPIESNLQHVKQVLTDVIAGLPQAARKPVTLVAVSKTKPAEAVREAFAAGQRAFGENYAQEGVAKIEALSDLRPQGIEWHYIGPLQSNKARLVASHFDWVHGIDRLKIAEALSKHRPDAPLNVCVQVNVSGEPSKSGVTPADVPALAKAVARMPGLRLRGLMTIIENTPDESSQRRQFRIMREQMDALNASGLSLDTLSMGMSQDFRIAIEEGATLVRIGSAIFGARN
jgi:pyridoxal phosphate enzyme (YggS family)